MSAATNPTGLKRICTSCGSRFYDLNRRPIICPNCDTEFTGEIKTKSRRSRIAPESKKDAPIAEQAVNENEEEDILEEDDDLEVVSLEDVDELDDEDDDEDGAIKLDEDSDLDDLADFDDDLDEDLEDDEAILDEDED